MSRKNIFQLIEATYDIQKEVRKINKLFESEKYFQQGFSNLTFKQVLCYFLFPNWELRGTCISIDEFLSRANAALPNTTKAKEEQIVNNLEVMENFIKLFNENCEGLYDEHGVEFYEDFNSIFCHLINTLEKRMGLVTREYKDRIILYPENAPLEQVIDLCVDEDVQWELIRYVREKLTLAEKRKSLAYLATNLYIEEDPQEKDAPIKGLIRKACNILNNLHIRHNNKTGKWENSVLEGLDDQDANSLCDMVYNEMLIIVLLREHKTYEHTYSDFQAKQKAASATKKEV